jgi:hypothetical protein
MTFYSMDYLEVEYFGKNIGISYYKSDVETPKARLYRCLEPFSAIRKISGAQNWTECDWLEFFGAYLVDFRRWRAGRQELSHYVKQMLSQCQEWWIAEGVKDIDNPLIAAELLRSARGEFHTKVLDKALGIDSIVSTDTTNPRGQHVVLRLNERIRRAKDRNRTVICIETAPNRAEVVFVPLFDKDNQGAFPFPCLMTGERTISPTATEDEIRANLVARKALSTLLFYEGLRLKVLFGCGVRCPVRIMDWPERAWARINGDKPPPCCGRNKELIAFWEAGNKAKEQGLFQPSRWDYPHECA